MRGAEFRTVRRPCGTLGAVLATLVATVVAVLASSALPASAAAGKLRQGPFSVSTFDTPSEGLGVPVFRSNPGFVQGGFTGGGAREFDLPNLLYEQLGNVERRIVP